MPKSIKINLTLNFDFLFIGLVSSEPIYRVGWLLNEKINLQLTEAKPLRLLHPKTKLEQEFSLFNYIDESSATYELVQNKGINGVLIEEQKNIDYFLKITDFNANSGELLSKIKELKNINLAIKIQPGSLKSKNRLVFFEETD